jgi:5'-nucleotidase
MRILVTNDDGIHAPGLKAAEAIARALSDDVWVVAPETDQSGVSHSLTLSDPLRLREISERHFAVKGTPTDCVIMAVKNILGDHVPDLVLSGVNRGQNVADDVTYSGTVAGALEGTVLGIRSIALSQGYAAADRGSTRYETAVTLAPPLIKRLSATDLPKGTLLNINFPALPAEEVKGVRVTVQGKRDQAFLEVDRRVDGRGFPYYWLTFSRRPFELKDGTDLMALREGYVSVTPLQLDLTDHAALRLVEAAIV